MLKMYRFRAMTGHLLVKESGLVSKAAYLLLKIHLNFGYITQRVPFPLSHPQYNYFTFTLMCISPLL